MSLPDPVEETEISPKQRRSPKIEDNKKLVGVPLLLVNGGGSPEDVLHAACDNNVAKLPSPEEVLFLGTSLLSTFTPYSSSLQILDYLGLAPHKQYPVPKPMLYQLYTYPSLRPPVQATRTRNFKFADPKPPEK